MPLQTFISTKWHRTGAVILFCAGAVLSAVPAPDEVTLVRTALDQVYRMEYAAAEETLTKGLPPESPSRPYFAGLACMNRFLDWGDTVALRRAEGYWEKLSPRGEPSKLFEKTDARTLKLYRGLAGVQLSYAASLRGQRLRSAGLALAARDRLDALSDPEARATLHLFDYYRGRFLEKLPFVEEPAFDLEAFTDAVRSAPALREMFQGSLFWIHMDHRRYGAAQALAADFLDRYPGNRLMRQMRGDVFLKAGKLAEARATYEKLREEYAALNSGTGTGGALGTSGGGRESGRLPLGYYRCVGNLARIEAAAGNLREAKLLKAEWARAERLGLMPWLPPVLKRDLDRM
jgi:tetratricopeptide (TPR) repeat protein